MWFINKIKEKFPQYETSNFGKPCLHNLGYWEGYEYDGVGAGAVGFKKWKMENGELWGPRKIENFLGYRERIFRYNTQENVYEYLKNPTQYSYEYLTPEDIKKEKVFLGLRSIVGFEENILNEQEKKRVEILINEKKLHKKENRIYSNDFLLADALTLWILE